MRNYHWKNRLKVRFSRYRRATSMAMDLPHMPLDEVRAKQREFLEVLESEVKERPEALIDPVAIGQRIGLPQS
jgi:hypothetical protein